MTKQKPAWQTASGKPHWHHIALASAWAQENHTYMPQCSKKYATYYNI
jgi:hypothetical protein